MKIIPISSGSDSKSFQILAEGRQLILRVGGRRKNYDVEHTVLNMIRKRKGLVPKGISASSEYSLQEKIDGVNLYDTPKERWSSIIREVGKQLKIIHSIMLPGFGQIDPQIYRNNKTLCGQNKSWPEFLNEYYFAHYSEIKSKIESEIDNKFINSKLSVPRQKQLIEILQREQEIKARLSKLPEIDTGHLLHGDLHFENILVRDRKLSGLIDFNKTFVGDPLFDIAYFSVMPDGELYPELLKKATHINFDQKRFDLYRLMISLGKVYTRYVRLDYLHDYPEVLDYLFAELNK